MRLRLSGKWLIVSWLSMPVLIAATNDAPLVEALKEKDQATIRSLLQQQVDVNAASADGATALHWAAHLDDLKTAQLLVRAGADVNVANRYGVTPLLLACTNGNVEMVKFLLESKADPNSALPEGETALMTAARTGKVEAVEALIAHGADMNASENWRQQTALSWAAAEGHVPVVELLIEGGADVLARSKAGFSPLMFAVREGHSGVAGSLLKAGADVNETLPGRTRRRYDFEPTSSADPATGPSPLDVAVRNAHFELADQLLDAGADPNFSGQGWTVLHTLVSVRKPGVGSNDPPPAGSGDIDSLELVRRLVAKGADVNARATRRIRAGASNLNSVGATPFFWAARTGDAAFMRVLAELGADPLLPNDSNTTPLLAAGGVGTRSNTEDAGTESKEDVLEAVKVALELGNDINAVDDRGETVMHGAAYKELPNVIRYLVEQGAAAEIWNQKNKLGWTPLRIATGVHRGMNRRTSPEAEIALREVMTTAGISTDLDAEEIISGATN